MIVLGSYLMVGILMAIFIFVMVVLTFPLSPTHCFSPGTMILRSRPHKVLPYLPHARGHLSSIILQSTFIIVPLENDRLGPVD